MRRSIRVLALVAAIACARFFTDLARPEPAEAATPDMTWNTKGCSSSINGNYRPWWSKNDQLINLVNSTPGTAHIALQEIWSDQLNGDAIGHQGLYGRFSDIGYKGTAFDSSQFNPGSSCPGYGIAIFWQSSTCQLNPCYHSAGYQSQAPQSDGGPAWVYGTQPLGGYRGYVCGQSGSSPDVYQGCSSHLAVTPSGSSDTRFRDARVNQAYEYREMMNNSWNWYHVASKLMGDFNIAHNAGGAEGDVFNRYRDGILYRQTMTEGDWSGNRLTSTPWSPVRKIDHAWYINTSFCVSASQAGVFRMNDSSDHKLLRTYKDWGAC